MPVPDPHRSPTADRTLPWDWARNAAGHTIEQIEHGGWEAMVTARAWHAATYDGPPQRKDYRLPPTACSTGGSGSCSRASGQR